jgi:hypothetical protein
MPRSPEWVEKDNSLLKRMAGKCAVEKIAKRLKRSISGIRNRSHELGLSLAFYKKIIPWSKRDVRYLLNHAGKESRSDIAFKLKRGVASVVYKAFSLRLSLTYGRAKHGEGHIDRWGYKTIAHGGKRVFEHRVIMEKHLGRPLISGETVHHQGAKLDNRIELLILKHKAHGQGQTYADELKRMQLEGCKLRFRKDGSLVLVIPAKLVQVGDFKHIKEGK